MKKTLFIAALLLSALTISARPYKHSVGINLGSANGLSYKGYVGDMDQMIVIVDLNTKVGASKGFYHENGYDKKEIQDYCNNKFGKGKFKDWDPNQKFVYWTTEVNPNLGYQREIADMSGASLHFIIGGGISVGFGQVSGYGDGFTAKDAWKYMKDARTAFSDQVKLAESDEKIYAGIGGSNINLNKEAGTDDFHRPYVLKFGANLLTGFEFCFKGAPIALGIDFRPGWGTFLDFTVAKRVNYTENEKPKIEKDAVRFYTDTFFDWSAGLSLRYFFGN